MGSCSRSSYGWRVVAMQMLAELPLGAVAPGLEDVGDVTACRGNDRWPSSRITVWAWASGSEVVTRIPVPRPDRYRARKMRAASLMLPG